MIERIYFLKKGGIENDGENIFFVTVCVYAITYKCVCMQVTMYQLPLWKRTSETTRSRIFSNNCAFGVLIFIDDNKHSLTGHQPDTLHSSIIYWPCFN